MNPLLEKVRTFSSLAFQRVRNAAIGNIGNLKDWSSIEKELSPEERKIEKTFFISTSVIGSIFFVSASSATYLEYQDLDFWPEPEVVFTETSDVILAEEGFFGKTSIPTVGDADRSEISTVTTYEVQPGDSLDLIAQKFGVRVRTLLDTNDIANPDSLKTGDTIKILPVDGYLYTVKPGDTLSEILQKTGVEEEVMKKQNKIGDDNAVVAGENLIIPGKTKPTPTPVPTAVVAKTPSTPARAPSSSSSSSAAATPKTPQVAYTPPRAGKSYSWPVVGRGQITNYYRYGHLGIDIWGPNNPGIRAIAAGTVTRALYHCGPRSYGCGDGGYGNVVVIDHGNGVKALYAHNSQVYVSVGDTVDAGQVIAKMGNTGNTYGRTGVHLHFELIINGRKQNPLSYL